MESARNDVDHLLQHFRIWGYAVIEGLAPAEKIDNIWTAYRPLLEQEIARDNPESSGTHRPDWQVWGTVSLEATVR